MPSKRNVFISFTCLGDYCSDLGRDLFTNNAINAEEEDRDGEEGSEDDE